MGCVQASAYTSGTILSTFTGPSASGDCDQECGICCEPECNTNAACYTDYSSDYDPSIPCASYSNLQWSCKQNSGGRNFTVYWGTDGNGNSLQPAGTYVILWREADCAIIAFMDPPECPYSEGLPCEGGNDTYEFARHFQAKCLICNGDGTWTDAGTSLFDSTKRAGCNSNSECGFVVVYDPTGWGFNSTGCQFEADPECASGGIPWSCDYGPWYDWSTDQHYHAIYGSYTDAEAECCFGGVTINENCCQKGDAFESTQICNISLGDWAIAGDQTNFHCADVPQSGCNGLWITGNTCQTYDCTVHNT